MTKSQMFVVIEVPHQHPARVYEATEQQLIDWALEHESDYLMDNSLYDSDDSISLEDACEALGHDMHSFAIYNSVDEAKKYIGNGHQHIRVASEIRNLEKKIQRERQEVPATKIKF